MKTLNDTTADTLTAISSISTLAHMATSFQPLTTAEYVPPVIEKLINI